jgi:putative membrane protein
MNITPQEQKDKNIFRLAMGISVFVFIVVIVLNKQVLQKPDVIPSWTYTLPLINAIINGTCSVLLIPKG